MPNDMDDIFDALDRSDEKTKQAVTRAKKASKAKKPPETLDEAFDRVLGMKLKDDEKAIVRQIKELIETGEVKRDDPTKKLSKKEVFLLWGSYQEVVKERKRQHVIDTKPDNFWIVTNTETLSELMIMLASEPLTAWDTETTGLDIFNDKIVGYSVYLPNHDVAAYVPFGHTTGQTQIHKDDALTLAKEYLENPNNKTIWHNYSYDGHMFLNDKITVANPYWDTCIVSKILNEKEANHKLKSLYDKYVLGSDDKSDQFSDLFDDAVIYDKDIILSGIYAAGDAHKTFKLYAFQKPYIDTVDNLRTVWYKIEQPLIPVDLSMERTGWRIDLERIERLKTELQPHLIEAEKAIKDAFNIDEAFLEKMSSVLGRNETEFNVNSPQHLSYLIYDFIGVDENFGKKFGKASRTTSADVIEAICKDHEQLESLLEYRKLGKLLSTYLEKIPNAMEPATGRLHCRFNNMGSSESGVSSGTETGRYSSSTYVSGRHSRTGDTAKGSNLQNLPSKGIGVEVRKCFIPDDGWTFIGADLSAIEPRVIAHVLATEYNDRSMLDFYLANKDLYTEMAMLAFGFPRENCVDKAYSPDGSFKPRTLMKMGVLSYLYGSSSKSFARSMKVSEEIAADFFNKMIQAFPGLEVFRKDVLKKLLQQGSIAYAQTKFGRKRRFPEYRKNYVELQKLNRMKPWQMTNEEKSRRSKLWGLCASVERQALNHQIQGTAADILKQNLVRMHAFCRENGYKLICSIHDEIIISVPKRDLSLELIEQVRSIMCDTVKLAVPLKTDIVIMPERWMQEYEVDQWDFEHQCPKEAS